MEKNIQNKTQGITDMTRGNPLKLILAFAIPMLIGTLFQQFYSMVDTVMVGKYLGVIIGSCGFHRCHIFMVNGFVIGKYCRICDTCSTEIRSKRL